MKKIEKTKPWWIGREMRSVGTGTRFLRCNWKHLAVDENIQIRK